MDGWSVSATGQPYVFKERLEKGQELFSMHSQLKDIKTCHGFQAAYNQSIYKARKSSVLAGRRSCGMTVGVSSS